MNYWILQSIKLAKGKFYLDNLLEIYPPDEISRGKLVEKESPQLKRLFQERRCKKLVKELVKLKSRGFKFPIEHPYISFISHYEDAINKNPITIEKICDKLFEMNYNELKEKLEAPKKASRRLGPMFKTWLRTKFNFLGVNDFESSNGLVFLNGSDNILKSYAETNLKCKFRELSKGLDFVAKIHNDYIIGTAKFITDFGGSQGNQFNEAVSFLKDTSSPSNIIKVAIIDGVPWRSKKMISTIGDLRNNEFCFSALLLEDFLNKRF